MGFADHFWPSHFFKLQYLIITYLHFRFVMRSLNISGRRIVSMEEVDEMIRAVDDGDGLLDYGEFVNLIQRH